MRKRNRGGGRSDTTPDGTAPWTGGPAVDDALRQMVGRWTLQHKAGVPARLGVTSSLRGEGVTFVSRALARVLAHDLERSVCLVDLNWWRAPVDGGPAGVAELAAGSVSADEVVTETAQPGLWHLPPGRAVAEDRPVLAHSPRLDEILVALGQRFDHVVLDLPALSQSGSLALASVSHSCVLVVRHGVTTIDQVQRSLDELAYVPPLGVVLNRVERPRFLASLVAG